jgi:branched-chain amino acid transport system substrate-binding protein
MMRRDFLGSVAMTTLATGLQGLASRPAFAADEIRIGALCELSGPASTLGSQQALGIQMCVDDINRNGGLLGRKVSLIIEDTETKVATGLAKAKKLVERDGVVALTGVVFSSISVGVQEYVNSQAKIPFINSGSSSPAISQPPACGRYVFQCQPSARAYTMAAQYAAQKKGRRWFFLADDFPWGRDSVKLMKEAIGLLGPAQTLGEEYAPLGTNNYAPFITKIMAANPDVVGLVVFGAGYSRALKQMQQMGMKAHKHHYFWSQVDAAAAGDAAIGMTAAETYTFENPANPRALKFATEFERAQKAWPDPVAARGYTGMELLALAMRAANSTSAEAVVNALEKLDHKDSLLGRLKFRECDHVAETPMLIVEGAESPKYKIYPRYVQNVAKPDQMAVPCGQTGCEARMKA